jgi:hypothetical protein
MNVQDRSRAPLSDIDLTGIDAQTTTVLAKRENEPASIGARLCWGGGDCVALIDIA